jgi:hypothetical protein
MNRFSIDYRAIGSPMNAACWDATMYIRCGTDSSELYWVGVDFTERASRLPGIRLTVGRVPTPQAVDSSRYSSLLAGEYRT